MVPIGRWTAFLQCSVALASENEQTAAEGLRVTVAVSGLTAFLQVFRASNIKVSRRLQRGAGYGSHELFDLIFTSVLRKVSNRLQSELTLYSNKKVSTALQRECHSEKS